MGRFTLTQLFMGVWLIAILIALVRSEGCGRHYEQVSCVTFSPDGARLAVAKHDARHANVPLKLYLSNVCRTVSVLQVPSLRTEVVVEQDLLRGNQGPTFGIYKHVQKSLGFLTDSQSLAVVNHVGGAVRSYDVETSAERILTEPQYPERNLCVSPDRSKACTSFEGHVRIWAPFADQKSVSLIAEEKAFAGCSLCSFSPDGSLLATAGDLSAALFNAVTGSKIATFHIGMNEYIVAIEFSPNGERIVLVSESHAYLYSAQGQHLATLDLPENRVTAARLLPNGNELVCASGYGYDREALIAVVDLEKPNQFRSLFRGPTVRCLESSPDGKLLAVGDIQGMVSLIDVQSGNLLAAAKPAGHASYPWTVPVAFLALWGVACRWLVLRSRSRRASGNPTASLICRLPRLV